MYIWQHPEWPRWTWDELRVVPTCVQLAERRGRLRGRLENLGIDVRANHRARVLEEDAASTAKVEGELLPPASLRSSIVRRLGLDRAGFEAPTPRRRDERVEGLLEVLEDATVCASRPLTHERLHEWHRWLFRDQSQREELRHVGAYRSEGIQVVSGKIQAPTVHFEAVPANRIPAEMDHFLTWWNTHDERDPVVKAAIAHLWFETIHPYEDGNGRLGRAISDMGLARADGQERRAFSLSRQILADQPAYYAALEQGQKLPSSSSTTIPLDATPWVEWFLGCVLRAIQRAEHSLTRSVLRSRLAALAPSLQLNPRQVKALERLIECHPEPLEGGLTNAKYRSLTRSSDTTASRDLAQLAAQGLLVPTGQGGRSTAYQLDPERVLDLG